MGFLDDGVRDWHVELTCVDVYECVSVRCVKTSVIQVNVCQNTRCENVY